MYVLRKRVRREDERETKGRKKDGEGENRMRECVLCFCMFKIHLKVSYKHSNIGALSKIMPVLSP